ncbi:Vta1 like-domain-containing protein [Phakopsora pachyrhizi]|nr:Vta1 like-domain-containing protein [Phakopsora pachyrhizi]
MELSDLPTAPMELKSINPYLQRAREMERVDPVISYWCSFHAAQTCMSIGKTSTESREFLMKLLDLLEHVKGKISDNDAISNNLAATAYVENFGLKIFDSADDEDQRGLSNKSTAQRFLAAACFLEVLQSLTNQPDPEILQKIKYSKWKATKISKAIRDNNLADLKPSTPTDEQRLTDRNGADNRRDFHQPDSNDPRGEPKSADTADDGENRREDEGLIKGGWPTELGSNQINKLPSPLPSSSALASNLSSTFPSTVFLPTQDPNNVSISAPAPIDSMMSSNTNNLQLSSSEQVLGPSLDQKVLDPIEFLQNDRSKVNISHQLSDPTAREHQQQQQQRMTFYSSSASANHQAPSSSNKSTLEPSATIDQILTTTSGSSGSGPSKMIDPMKVLEVQKHAKWAISALNFEDLETARKELRIATETLNSIN